MKDIAEKMEVSGGAVWDAISELVDEKDTKYQWFKDMAVHRKLQGVRVKGQDTENRIAHIPSKYKKTQSRRSNDEAQDQR